MKEVWKKIPEYPMYECSNYGRIRSWKDGRFGVLNEPKLIKLIKSNHGYPRVALSNRPAPQKKVLVHRIVAQLFIANPNGKPFVNHIDSDRANNRVDNLEWCTHQENVFHCHSKGRISFGEKKKNAKLTEEKVKEIWKTYKKESQKDVAKRLGVSATAVSLVTRGLQWKHVKKY